MAEPLILAALTRIAVEPAGLPLFAGKATGALFAASAAGKQAAQRCKEDGLVRILRSEKRGKSTLEICGITEKGLSFLLERANPRPVLEAIVRTLEGVALSVETSQRHLHELKSVALSILNRLQTSTVPLCQTNGAAKQLKPGVAAVIQADLTHWQDNGALGDCPLPILFRRLRESFAELTIGQFHDALRLLQQAPSIYLHPWTGPLYELPEPALALMVGHEIAYYASLRSPESE